MKPTVSVTIDRADLKRDVSLYTNMNPYFIATLGTQSYKSKEILNGQSPVWDEAFTFYLENTNTTLLVNIYHQQILVYNFNTDWFN